MLSASLKRSRLWVTNMSVSLSDVLKAASLVLILGGAVVTVKVDIATLQADVTEIKADVAVIERSVRIDTPKAASLDY